MCVCFFLFEFYSSDLERHANVFKGKRKPLTLEELSHLARDMPPLSAAEADIIKAHFPDFQAVSKVCCVLQKFRSLAV